MKYRKKYNSSKYMKYFYVIAFTIFASLCLSGCSDKTQTGGNGTFLVNSASLSMESTAVVDYVLPRSAPNVMVDRCGYETGSIKAAAVKGHELGETFRLVDAATDKTVYEGVLEDFSVENEEGIELAYADFSDFNVVGEYYIECDVVGRSYDFEIADDLYKKLFMQVCDATMDLCKKEISEGEIEEETIHNVTAMLTAYEWYPELFTETEDMDADSNDIPDMVEIIGDWLAVMDGTDTEITDESKAAIMAKYGYLYQKYDVQYATTYLQRASALFSQAQKTITKDSDNFFALVELYRATGLMTYRNQILEYASFFENNSTYLEDMEYSYATMTYMVTRQRVDIDLCDTFMKDIEARGEEVAERYTDMIHPINAKNNGTSELLKRAGEIIFANYVMPSYQYKNTVEDIFHYLGGCNLESQCFFTNQDDSGYILLLAQMAYGYDKELYIN